MANTRIQPAILLLLAAFACKSAAPAPAGPPPAPTPEPVRPTPRPVAPLKLGVILPSSASADLAGYGNLIREGIELAVTQYEARQSVRGVELVYRDDAGQPAGAARAVADLERDGAVAIIGPLLADGVEAAAAGRSSTDMLILSPTASAIPATAQHAYSLNAMDARGGAALAAWAARSGMARLAVMHATTPEATADARSFVQAAEAQGARVTLQLPFDPGTTTFSQPIERLKAAGVQAVFVSASERDIRQLAPQFAYFGLTGVQILGSESWVSPEVLRSVSARALEGVVAATPLVQGGGDSTAWSDFVQLYERTHRRTLDNPYPALGYDAANLVLQEIANGMTRPREVADALAATSNYRGATGLLSVQNGRLSRRPFLVRIRGGKTEPIAFPGQ